jgi:hypothetical protein
MGNEQDYSLSGKGLAALIILPTLATGIGVWWVLHLTGKPVKQATVSPTIQRVEVSQASPPIAPQLKPESRPVKTMPPPPAPIVVAPAQPQVSPAISLRKTELSIEDIDAFAKKLSDAAGREEQGISEASRLTNVINDTSKTTSNVSTITTDLKQYDSLIYPVVGEIVLSYYQSTLADGWGMSRSEKWTAIVGRRGSKWKCIKATSILQSKSQWPKPDREFSDDRENAEQDRTSFFNELIENIDMTEDQFRQKWAVELRRK